MSSIEAIRLFLNDYDSNSIGEEMIADIVGGFLHTATVNLKNFTEYKAERSDEPVLPGDIGMIIYTIMHDMTQQIERIVDIKILNRNPSNERKH